MQTIGEAETVLRGPMAVARGEGDEARNIVVRIGAQVYRIPIPAQGCAELAQALTLTDEELAAASTQQQGPSRLIIPTMESTNGGGH